MTILEMLDLLEAAILNNRRQQERTAPSTMTPADLRTEIESSELATLDFAAAFGIEPETLDHWLSGVAPIPEWFERSVSLYELLTPSARRKLLNRPKPARMPIAIPAPVPSPAAPHPLVEAAAPPLKAKPGKKPSHPFSRIDEL